MNTLRYISKFQVVAVDNIAAGWGDTILWKF